MSVQNKRSGFHHIFNLRQVYHGMVEMCTYFVIDMACKFGMKSIIKSLGFVIYTFIILGKN